MPARDVAPIAKKVDQKIPLVFVSSADPEQLGLVASLRRPGGNATGVTLFQDALASKRLELLKEALPNISRVGFIWYPDHPDNEYREAQRAAQTLGLRLHSAEVRSSDDFEAALSRANDEGIDAIYVVSSRLTVLNLKRLVQFATQHHLPLVGGWGAWAKEGGLFSYGPDGVAMAGRLDSSPRRARGHFVRNCEGFADAGPRRVAPGTPGPAYANLHKTRNPLVGVCSGMTSVRRILSASHLFQTYRYPPTAADTSAPTLGPWSCKTTPLAFCN